jgi:predicted alpha/beta superfamily hydrolase
MDVRRAWTSGAPLIAASALMLSVSAQAQTQAAGSPVAIGEALPVRSQVLKQDRRIFVSKPPGYEGETERYPVLYLLDGETHFPLVAGMVQFLAGNDRIPEMIVIGVASGSLTQRRRDLTTPSQSELDSRFSPGHGGADEFLKFLEEELIPKVDRSYRTRPYRILVGHSLGGLFAVHSLIAKPKLFNAYIAIDPSLEWNNGSEVVQAAKFFAAHRELPADLVMTAANDLGRVPAAVRQFASILDASAPKGFRWRFEWLKDESHGSAPLRSIDLGLNAIFAGWRITNPLDLFDSGGLEAIHRHFREGGKRYGYERTTSPFVVSLVVAALIRADRLDEASAVLLHDAKGYPPPWNQLDAIARRYAAQGLSDKAIRFYRLSLKQNPGNDWARKKLLEYGVSAEAEPEER